MVYGTQITIVIGPFVNQLSYLGGPTLSEFQNDEMRFGIASGPVRHPMEIQQPRHAGRLLPMAAGSKNKFPQKSSDLWDG